MRLLSLLLESVNGSGGNDLGVMNGFRVKKKVNGSFLLFDKSVDAFQKWHAENQKVYANRNNHERVLMRDIGDGVL